jgi:hypothetical protein
MQEPAKAVKEALAAAQRDMFHISTHKVSVYYMGVVKLHARVCRVNYTTTFTESTTTSLQS